MHDITCVHGPDALDCLDHQAPRVVDVNRVPFELLVGEDNPYCLSDGGTASAHFVRQQTSSTFLVEQRTPVGQAGQQPFQENLPVH